MARPALSGMGLEYLLNHGLTAQQAGRMTEAEHWYGQVLAAYPNEVNANHLLGVLRLHQGRADEALVLIDRALAPNPNFAEVQAHRALVLHHMGRDSDALAALDKALALEPEQLEALNSRGVVLRALGRPQESLASLDTALKLEPGFAEAWNNHGIALLALGRPEEARASFDKAASLDRHNVEIQINRGAVCRDLGHCREAIGAFQTVLEQAPGHIASLYNLALMQCEAGDTEQAMASFRSHAALVLGTASAGPDPDFKRLHDEEQKAYLAERGAAPDAGARLSGPAVNRDNDLAAIAARWQTARPQVVVIDNLLTPPALDALRRFCWQEPVWKKLYDNRYLGAVPELGFAAPLLAQIADELRQTYDAIVGAYPLRYLWAFKCDSHLKGVKIHADFAAVNVNFWITPDEANMDPDRGGLVIWDVAAPLDWDFAKYNNDDTAIRAFLAENGAKSVTVPYRANRAVIFDSDLFHETDRIAFKDGYTNRRMNITMLYGRRRSHEGMPPLT